MRKPFRSNQQLRFCAGAFVCFCLTASAFSQVPSAAVNISTRMRVETGDNVLIGGFIVIGAGQKRVAVRALGPSLPVAGALNNPILELHDATGAIVASNDNWRTSQQDGLIAAGMAPADDLDAALIATLNVGNYTAVVRGVSDAVGVALVEVYDLDGPQATARFANISTRGRVQTGDDVMIGGFILRGDLPKRMIMRVRGPTLSLNGTPIPGRLDDPTLELFDGNGQRISENDSWRSAQEAEIAASSIPPTDDREPAIVVSLNPGNYTAIVRGKNGTSGVGLIEFYDLDQPPQADGSTLYLSQLRAQGSNVSNGSGSATLRLAGDEKSAVLAFNYTNLSAPVTSIHIHGPGGIILFDLDDPIPQPDGTFIWVFAPVGNTTVADILAALKSGQTYLNIHTSNYPTGEIAGFFNFSAGGQAAPAPTPPPALAAGTPTPTDAARFLEQATFGPKAAQITQVRSQGFDAFLNEQFNAPPTYLLPYVDASGVIPPAFAQVQEAWWNRTIAAPDQMRQRVAFALSEILVVSAESAGLGNEGVGLATYYDVLLRNAFGNFRTLLDEVTLNPAMGRFLDMLRNEKADPARGRIPNENFAREILQLFSIGTYRLHLDGSLAFSSLGLPIETYGQEAILGLSEVFTGWTYAHTGTPRWNGVPPNYREPMISVPSRHEMEAKVILDGVALPANQSAPEDLGDALDTIFAHPNVGPFICQQLIQRLVTSNPSPGYVHRVASIFNNNGQGVRGDLRAVVRAILMDYDARGESRSGQGAGHLREPVLRVTSLLRAFGASTPTGKFSITGLSALGQTPLRAPTVFNFFSPDYQSPGPIAEAHLKSPEFQITTETTVVTIANYLRNAVNFGLGPADNRTTLNLAYELSIAGNSAQLVDHLNGLLMASGMSPEMRSIMITTLDRIAATNPTERVRTAIYLIVTSPEYVIQK
ncbi:MAG: DUF1800 family protein [Verrucomicrobiota bacterium]|nr:DUF1800 family protein [Verrucomicrobiota bacterium]